MSSQRADSDSKMYSKFADVSSSQSNNSRSDMNNSANDKKKDYTEEYFDSGVISDAIVSSEFSEIDIDAEKPSVGAPNTSCADSSSDKTETTAVMALDSGIDIDIYSSDQFNSRSGFSSEKIHAGSESLKCETPKIEVSHHNAEESFPDDPVFILQKLFAGDEDGDTQLHNAILGRCEKVFEYLLFLVPSSGFLDIQNNDLQTCLHLSVMTNQPKMTRLLLLAGARTGIEDRNGDTPLHLACGVNSFDCVEALLTPIFAFEKEYYRFKYIPDIDSPRNYMNTINYEGLSSIHIAAERKHYSILHTLLMNGADVNIKELKAGYTLLHEAVASGNIDLVNYILHHPKLNIETKNYATYTAYQLSSDYPAISRILLNRNAQKLEFFEDESDNEYSSDSEDENEPDEDSLFDVQVSNSIHALGLNNSTIVS